MKTMIPSDAPRLLYNTTDAGEQLSISRAEVARLIDRGLIRAVHVGRLVRVPHSALLEYLEYLERLERGE